MRYTTIIDLTELRTIYKSTAARLVYLHMVLKSGYHDSDRDMLTLSIRQIAADVGVTVSAARHALAVLEKAQLIRREGPIWVVKKWLLSEDITKRPATKRQQQQIDAALERRKAQEQLDLQQRIEQAQREQQLRSGKTSFMIYYEAQQRLAASGDADAQKNVERYRATYEEAVRNVREKMKQQK